MFQPHFLLRNLSTPAKNLVCSSVPQVLSCGLQSDPSYRKQAPSLPLHVDLPILDANEWSQQRDSRTGNNMPHTFSNQ